MDLFNINTRQPTLSRGPLVEDGRHVFSIAHWLQANALWASLACLSICTEFDPDGILLTVFVDVRADCTQLDSPYKWRGSN